MDANSGLDFELPSLNESRSDIPEGSYVFEFVGMDGPYENRFNENQQRWLFKFQVTDSPDDPDQVGKVLGQFMTLTNSPKGNLYPIYKALKGGNIDANERWQMRPLLNRRFRGTIVMKTPDNGGEPRPKLEGATPVRVRPSEQPNVPF